MCCRPLRLHNNKFHYQYRLHIHNHNFHPDIPHNFSALCIPLFRRIRHRRSFWHQDWLSGLCFLPWHCISKMNDIHCFELVPAHQPVQIVFRLQQDHNKYNHVCSPLAGWLRSH